MIGSYHEQGFAGLLATTLESFNLTIQLPWEEVKFVPRVRLHYHGEGSERYDRLEIWIKQMWAESMLRAWWGQPHFDPAIRQELRTIGVIDKDANRLGLLPKKR